MPALASAATIQVSATGVDAAGCGTDPAPRCRTIQFAVDSAAPSDTVAVGTGTFVENVTINKPLTVIGSQSGVDARTRGGAETVVQSSTGGSTFTISAPVRLDGFTVTGATNAGSAALDYAGNVAANGQFVRNLIFDDNFDAVYGVFGSDSIFTQNRLASTASRGLHLSIAPQEAIRITNNLFEAVAGEDIIVDAPGSADLTIARNTHVGGAAAFLTLLGVSDAEIIDNTILNLRSWAIYLGGGDHGVEITNNIIEGGAGSNGISIANQAGFGRNSGIAVFGNSITGTLAAVHATAGPASLSDNFELHKNRFTNTGGVINETNSGGAANAENNWWGCNEGPGVAGCDPTSGNVDAAPRLILSLTASPTELLSGEESALTASVRTNSNSDDVGPGFPNGAPVGYSTTLGTVPAAVTTTAARAVATLASGDSVGTATVSATLDNQTVTTPVTIGGALVSGPSILAGCTNKIKGQNGPNVLIGTSGADLIKGRRRDDRIVGNEAQDCLSGGHGNDRILARDGLRDLINCGAGHRDVVKADAIDLTKDNCERVKVKP